MTGPPAGRGRLVVLSGPSGVGKTTVVRHLRERYPRLWVSVSATTRFPRPGERDGVHYHFLDREEFLRRARAGEFLEWAEFAGNLYGTPAVAVETALAAGRDVLLEIDLAGARQVRDAVPDALLVFLRPPSWQELVRRLTGRGTEPAPVVEARLAVAREEMAAEPEFDATLVNGDVQKVCAELVALLDVPRSLEA